MSAPAIQVDNLSKLYHIGARERYHTFREAIIEAAAAPLRRLRNFGRASSSDSNIIWALNNASFEVEPGEVVGVIGRNGSGKSTLLKILSRITEPTEGRVHMRGRVGSLLEVGTGFHPELTGRENIYLSGAILGMKRAEINHKFDEIVDFSGVTKFIDTPVKRYSSGMKVRLGFAVAAHLDPEILLIDEVLAVGDAEFQNKCLGKMDDVAKSGRTVLFVSHNMGAIADLCPRTLLLSRGSLQADGSTPDVVSEYLTVATPDGYVDLRHWELERSGDGPMRIEAFEILDSNGARAGQIECGEPIRFRFSVRGKPGARCNLSVAIRDMMERIIYNPNTRDDKATVTLPAERSVVELFLQDNRLARGDYSASVWLGDAMNVTHDRVHHCLKFRIEDSSLGQTRSKGLVRTNGQWSVKQRGI